MIATMPQPAPIKPYNLEELARLYDISTRIMRGWLLKAGMLNIRTGYYYTVSQVEKIFSHLGPPQVDNDTQTNHKP